MVSEVAPLLDDTGLKAIPAAKCYVAWHHEVRICDETAFACLAGVNSLPVSSGNTTLCRPNRGGERSLNAALNVAVMTRMSHREEDTHPC